MFFQRRRFGVSADCSVRWRAALDAERPPLAAIIGGMNPGVLVAIGVAAIVVIVLVSLRVRAHNASRERGLQLEVSVRAKNMNVILIGQTPISPTHSRWVYDLEKSMIDGGLITKPGGKNWLPTDEGKKALEARLNRDEKPLRALQPLVNAENLQNVVL